MGSGAPARPPTRRASGSPYEGAAPKTLAPHFETGPEAGDSNHGIYEFVGEEWRFCLNMTGGAKAPS